MQEYFYQNGDSLILPELNRVQSIMLVKLAQHMDSLGFEKITLMGKDDGGSGFVSNGILLGDAYSTHPPHPALNKNFREGLTLDEFILKFFTSFADDFLDQLDGGENQSMALTLSKDSKSNQWSVVFYLDENVDTETIQEESYSIDEAISTSKEDTLFRKIVAFMRKHEVDQIVHYYSGGGDSGDLNSIESELDEETMDLPIDIEDNSSPSFKSVLEDFSNEVLKRIDNWYDDLGGQGHLTITREGVFSRYSEYYENEDKVVVDNVRIQSAITIRTFSNSPSNEKTK